eukprot:TRINITY_DN15515_c0_g1_i1.p1 TRINITY_DN15515_c0_g1~~TRINITY_DN15515_c0_g1_i1.p1  ORF type:complete len:542 (+),score=134.01 TRINITY_DN15515_c0_g1_i1:127-1752(+)
MQTRRASLLQWSLRLLLAVSCISPANARVLQRSHHALRATVGNLRKAGSRQLFEQPDSSVTEPAEAPISAPAPAPAPAPVASPLLAPSPGTAPEGLQAAPAPVPVSLPAPAPGAAPAPAPEPARPIVADFGEIKSSTADAVENLTELAWPDKVEDVDVTALGDVAAVSGKIKALRILKDEWSRHCTSRSEAAKRLLTIATNEQAGADIRVANMAAKMTGVQAKEQEVMIKLGNLQNRCFDQMKQCNRHSKLLHTEQENLAASNERATAIKEKFGATMTKADTFEEVQGVLANQSQRLDDHMARHSTSCVAQMLFLDKQVETNSAAEHAFAQKRMHLNVEHKGALKVQKVAMAAADVAIAMKEHVDSTCKNATAKADKGLQSLRIRRAELAKGVISDCHVSDWQAAGADSACNADCGGGTRRLARQILVNAGPSGDPCPSLMETELSCNLEPCAQDCKMSEWSAWTPCSATCGGGIRARRRSILKAPVGAGAACLSFSEHEVCNPASCGRSCERSDAADPLDDKAPAQAPAGLAAASAPAPA